MSDPQTVPDETSSEPANRRRPHVVIVGAGFAGLECAKGLKRAEVDVTIVDKQNHHLFQPLLYQVATAALAGPDIAAPVRKILHRQKNVRVLLDEVLDLHTDVNAIRLRQRGRLEYDYLVVATGSQHSYFGHDEWERFAPGLKTLSDAFEIRRRMLMAFEAAEREIDKDLEKEWLTFVIVGGGPTGVELAGAISEIAQQTMIRDFRNFDSRDTRVILLEGMDRILLAYPEDVSARGIEQLEELGVEVRTGAMVSGVDAGGVWIGEERIPARTVLWGAGVAGHPLGKKVGTELHKSGRVRVRPSLQVPGRDSVFVVGDLAWLEDQGEPVPALAPAAIQEGRQAAKNIRRLLAGKEPEPFHYFDKGNLATIGRSRAVGMIRKLKLSGFIAWFIWLFVHLMYLVGFRNRVMVLLQWGWAYLTAQRGARIIVEPQLWERRMREREDEGQGEVPSGPPAVVPPSAEAGDGVTRRSA